MIRRTILSAAAAIALVAMPMAAMAYDAPGYNTTVSDPTPAIGQAFTVTTTGATAGETLTLTITSNPATISNDAITIASLLMVAGLDVMVRVRVSPAVAPVVVTVNAWPMAGVGSLTVVLYPGASYAMAAIGIATSAMAAAAERMVRRIMKAPGRIGAAWRCGVATGTTPPCIGKGSPNHEKWARTRPTCPTMRRVRAAQQQ